MKNSLIIILAVLMFCACNTTEKKQGLAVASSSELKPVKQDSELSESIARGESIYTDFCMSCHLPNGQGVANVYPPLANSDYLKNKQTESIKAIKYGLSGKIVVNGSPYNNVMSPMGLEDDETVDVMNYINNSWGNTFGTLITETQVSKIEQ
ncbi:cytochrome c [Subsaximicrobium wynnwilliamsii]|uniref:Cytochrome c n=1 Tax=Subsaximicrobium wynnwilliamsii TaxID=291179 RepID=A0A5C6ZR97_9FLAO|nr:cytochrome c [Subsaximicrobium wynnwilliamsii]TXD85077.1 cytochrome c [Subsaximicrobium wynnwilliamsii]TXD91120.1 cytochrome c [Subsaximicrobium wynnwilliamsii]TXE04514.1 cytochrome c [Subsaximicrobium wynnwilliamsii]